MSKKEYKKLSKELDKVRKNTLSSKKRALQSLIDAGIATKTGKLKKYYK